MSTVLRGFHLVSRGGAAVAFMVLVAALAAPPAAGQSCVLTRLDTPVLNAFHDEFGGAADDRRFQITFGYRYGYSFRHFVGTHEEPHRVAEHSQVVNNVSLFDLSLRYDLGSRTSLTLGVPYLEANRDGALRNDERVVVRRYTRSNTSGIGDVSLVANRLLWDPATHQRGNLSAGLGVKFPTGDHTQQQTRLSMNGDGEVESSVSVADYSVQPGDGAWGIIVGLSGYRVLNQAGSLALYGSGTYVAEPETTNGVRLGDNPGEEFVSAADQYVARLGLQLGPRSWRGLSLGLGGRVEGVPVHDAFGSSYGRRRPGYMLSVEPTVSWSRGAQSISLAFPYAVERNRQRSVADLADGGHGDAAFPDYLVLTNWSYRF